MFAVAGPWKKRSGVISIESCQPKLNLLQKKKSTTHSDVNVRIFSSASHVAMLCKYFKE